MLLTLSALWRLIGTVNTEITFEFKKWGCSDLQEDRGAAGILLSLVTKTSGSLQMSEWKMFVFYLLVVSLGCWIWFYIRCCDLAAVRILELVWNLKY